MINIAKKKLPSAVAFILVYLSYCAAGWYVMRGTMAVYGEHYGWPAWFANDIWAFFFGGIASFAVYALLSFFVYRMLAVRVGGDMASVRYGMHYAVILSNIVLFLLKFIYLAAPVQASMLNIIFDPTVTLAVVALYLWYAFYQNYVEKSMYRIVVSQVYGMFVTVYAVLTVINILMSVVG